MKLRFSILILLLLCLTSDSFSQTQLRFERIGINDGLSNQKVNCIFQDSRGFIWIGTGFGLNRYDGINCKTWYHDSRNKESLVNNNILSIAEDQAGRLWIGTQEGVSLFDPVKGNFINYSAKGAGDNYFNKENCYSFVDKNNTVWVGSNKGASWFDEKEKKFKDVSIELTRPGVNRNLFATSFLHDSKKRLWISTSYGIKLISPDKKNSTSFHFPETGVEKRNGNACTQVVEDRNGRIFAGTWNAGILYFDEHEQKFRQKNISPSPIINTVFSILPIVVNNSDYLWLGTNNGLFKIKTTEIFSSENINADSWVSDNLNLESISSNTIAAIIKDRNGITWFGTSTGLNKLDPLQQQFQTLFPISNRNNLQGFVALSENFDGSGMFISTSKDLFSTKYGSAELNIVSSSPSDLTCIEKGKQFYWIGSFNGLWQYDKKMNPLKKWFGSGYSTVNGNARIKSVLEDSEGKIWCGLWRGGIIKLDPQTGDQDHFLMDSLSGFDLRPFIINDITEDKTGNIWFASNNGLYQYNRSNNSFNKISVEQSANISNTDAIECVTEGYDGKIWIGTRQGLRYFDYASGKIFPVLLEPHINDYIYGIIEGPNGILWLATANGLLQYNPSTQQTRLFNSVSGLPENDLSNLFKKDKTGRIYIGFTNAITIFDPASIQKNNVAFSPVITNIIIDKKIFPVSNSTYKLKYNHDISIDFVALNYSNAQNNQYAYMLESTDKEWKQLGHNHNIYFANLPPGNYSLKIKASNSDGIWNETPAVLKFTVSPPFWKTWWFISLIVLLIAASAYAFYRIRLQKALELERLRTRIATDLHDDIGATLSSISMYSSVVKEKVKDHLPHLGPVLDKMGENSREMVTNMSDIVWAINPDNDVGEKLAQRMESYASDICALRNLRFQFSADKKLNDLKLPLEYRKNIYLIFKESLNNSLKYAVAEKISVIISKNGNQIILKISDDGKGFNTAMGSKGNGLKNMQARAKEIRGQVKIDSFPGEGTTIVLTCTI